MSTVNQQSRHNSSVLVVDSEQQSAATLTDILADNYDVNVANDLESAWRQLNNQTGVQLIFVADRDNIRPTELLGQIRSTGDRRIKRTPVIVAVPDDRFEQTRHTYLAAGASELVRQPFQADEIKHKVNYLLPSIKPPDQNKNLVPESVEGVLTEKDFFDVLSSALSYAIRNRNEMVLVLVKFDRYESICAHYSGPAYEHVLAYTAQMIRTHIRSEDKLAYLGDGLYAVLLPATNSIGAKYMSKRILDELTAKAFNLEDGVVTASIGISAPEITSDTTVNSMLALAETRLKSALEGGGNRFVDSGQPNDITSSALLRKIGVIDPERAKIAEQIDAQMRQLAQDEYAKIKADYSAELSKSASAEDKEIIALLHMENKQLKEAAVDQKLLKQQIDDLEQALSEQERQNNRLTAENEQIRKQNLTQESEQPDEGDHSFIEENLLEEIKQLEAEIENQRQGKSRALNALHKAETIAEQFKKKLLIQRNQFENLMVNTQTGARPDAAASAETQQKSKPETDPFGLTALPSIEELEKDIAKPDKPKTAKPALQHQAAKPAGDQTMRAEKHDRVALPSLEDVEPIRSKRHEGLRSELHPISDQDHTAVPKARRAARNHKARSPIMAFFSVLIKIVLIGMAIAVGFIILSMFLL